MNRARLPTCVAVLVLPLLMVACASTSLINLDDEWKRTYVAALRPADKGDYLVSAGDYGPQFADLSDRAAAAGNEARSKDRPLAIGFYRIAALAAWKSAALREDKVPELAAKGSAACDALPNKAASQPRDCAIFRFVDYFAVYDKVYRDLRVLIDVANARPNNDLPADRIDEARQVHRTISRVFEQIDKRRQVIGDLAPSDSFHGYLNENWKQVYCGWSSLAATISRSISDEPEKQAIRNQSESMQKRLKEAHVNTQCG